MSRKIQNINFALTQPGEAPTPALPLCGFRKNCAGYRCSRQPKPADTTFDDQVESGAAEASAAFEADARAAHAAALIGSFDPDDLADLEPALLSHALARRKDIDPHCDQVKRMFEDTKDEVWAPFAESNLKRLAGGGGDYKKPFPRKRKRPEDPALRPNLFRDCGVALPPSSPRPGKQRTKRPANSSTE